MFLLASRCVRSFLGDIKIMAMEDCRESLHGGVEWGKNLHVTTTSNKAKSLSLVHTC